MYAQGGVPDSEYAALIQRVCDQLATVGTMEDRHHVMESLLALYRDPHPELHAYLLTQSTSPHLAVKTKCRILDVLQL